MKKITLLTLLLLSITSTAYAEVEPNYNSGEPRITTPWYGYVGQAEKQADMDFIIGMRPHHAGALTMSHEYLKNNQSSNASLRALARGIIDNQTFEIGMLDHVEALLSAVDIPEHRKIKIKIADQGLAQKQKFIRTPMPAYVSQKGVTEEDVRFAKAMIVHHKGALIMAQDYLNNPAASNEYLELMCVDILRDQEMEIAFMQDVINAYPGNSAEIKIDPSMVHGMGGMSHHMTMH